MGGCGVRKVKRIRRVENGWERCGQDEGIVGVGLSGVVDMNVVIGGFSRMGLLSRLDAG